MKHKEFIYKTSKRRRNTSSNWYINNKDKVKNNYKNNKKRILAKNEEYRQRNLLYLRGCYLRRNYGLSLEQFNEMFKRQDGCCAICGTHQSKLRKSLAVDHDHKTLKVRELLCIRCNGGIALFMDSIENMEKAINYLRKHKDN